MTPRLRETLTTCRKRLREGARLMGLPDSYVLPAAATGALHVAGDGVVVPVVRWLAATILEPLLAPAGAAVAAE